MQYLIAYFGGKVHNLYNGEFGKATLIRSNMSPNTDSSLLKGLPKESTVWMSHCYSSTALPEGFVTTGSTKETSLSAAEHTKKKIFMVQFHPEVKNTEFGRTIYKNFIASCGLEINKKINYPVLLQTLKKEIKTAVGSETVLLALSGGADSSILYELLALAIPNQLQCVYVDTGFMRKGETDQMIKRFAHRNESFTAINAKERFAEKLRGVSDPEEKRRIIGHEFIAVFKETVPKMASKPSFLAQGTISSDVIESQKCGVDSVLIKTHHNVGGLPKELGLNLLEPFRTYFKDQIKQIGREMSLGEEVLMQHPFPGPGIAIRVLGEPLPEFVKVAREADSIFIKTLKEKMLYGKVSQAYAAVLPCKSVGVVGDNRRVGVCVVLRAVVSVDYMTAVAFEFPAGFLADVSGEIVNSIEAVARVFYDVTSKPPATIELE